MANVNREGFLTSINCFRCGRWKGSPSRPCDYCGDQPLPWDCSTREICEFNRAYGFRF